MAGIYKMMSVSGSQLHSGKATGGCIGFWNELFEQSAPHKYIFLGFYFNSPVLNFRLVKDIILKLAEVARSFGVGLQILLACWKIGVQKRLPDDISIERITEQEEDFCAKIAVS